MGLLATANPITFVLTTDRPRARAFYEGVLGLPLISQDDFAAVYSLNGTLMRLTDVPGHKASAHIVLGWSVPDIAATSAALQAKGVEFAIYDGMDQDAHGIWTSPDGAVKVNFFADPDGNKLSLTEG